MPSPPPGSFLFFDGSLKVTADSIMVTPALGVVSGFRGIEIEDIIPDHIPE